MNKKRLLIEQLGRKLTMFDVAYKVTVPPTGWIKAVRLSLGMTLQQLADRLAISKQSVQEIETREQEGGITLKNLRETANALDMRLVYGFVPKDGTIDALIERKARELAIQIVSRTSTTMKLEDQENSEERLKKAIDERTAIIKNELPRILWN
jgi:predicted DNA-binding mobile mystery protein A